LLPADAVVGGEEFLLAGDVEVKIGVFLVEINERYMLETVDGLQQGLVNRRFFEGGAREDSGFFNTVRVKKSKLVTKRAVVVLNWIGNVGRQIAGGQDVSVRKNLAQKLSRLAIQGYLSLLTLRSST